MAKPKPNRGPGRYSDSRTSASPITPEDWLAFRTRLDANDGPDGPKDLIVKTIDNVIFVAFPKGCLDHRL